MNKIIRITILFMISFIFLACDKSASTSNLSNQKNELLAKYEKISVGMTREEVNEILTIHNAANDSYEGGKITVSYYGTNNTVSSVAVQLTYNNEEVLNAKTNLKKAKEFTDKLNKSENVTYASLVAAFKNDGYCIRKNTDGCKSYAWADKEGRYITASISSENRVSSIFGKA